MAVPSSGFDHARELDAQDPLGSLRQEFVIPTKQSIADTRLVARTWTNGVSEDEATTAEKCVYLCGNSLGLQPKRTATRIRQYLDTWGSQGVLGHFKPLEGSPLPTWLHVDAKVAEMIAPIVGADAADIAVMQTLTANLHLLMSTMYRPDPTGRHKILLEYRAFPSDHFAVESQVRHHGLSTDSSLVTIRSGESEYDVLTTEHILSVIDAHQASTALILLPGIQYYTGQLLDIPTITARAHSHNIPIIWDLAHAVGNVPLSLHAWDVDAAVWCSYKYLNGGPGCIGGLFVHPRHSHVRTQLDTDDHPENGYRQRLSGWWGNDKATRFLMRTRFHPVAGAAGFQLSNPSVLDITSLGASLEVFAAAGGMPALRAKSLRLTAFLQERLDGMSAEARSLFRVLTPRDPLQRGAQLSLLLAEGMLETVMHKLEAQGVVVDDRKPDVVRVAPAPLYNTFADCAAFADAFARALEAARPTLVVFRTA